MPERRVEHGEYRGVVRAPPIRPDDILVPVDGGALWLCRRARPHAPEHPAAVRDELRQPLLFVRARGYPRPCQLCRVPNRRHRVRAGRRLPGRGPLAVRLRVGVLRQEPVVPLRRADQQRVAVIVGQGRHNGVRPGFRRQHGGLVQHGQVKRFTADAVDVVAGVQAQEPAAVGRDRALGG